MLIGVSLLYLGIIAIEVPYLLKNKLWKELAAFSFLLLLAIVYSIGLVLNVQMPNLVDLLEKIFIPVTRLMESL